MATKKTQSQITMTPDELKALITEAISEALLAAKPQRSKQSEAEKEAKKAAENSRRQEAAVLLPDLPSEGIVWLRKSAPFHPQRVWSKTDPGAGLLVRFSPKDGSRQTWLIEGWSAAKSGNGFITVAKFVPEADAAAADDTEDFLRSVG